MDNLILKKRLKQYLQACFENMSFQHDKFGSWKAKTNHETCNN